MANPALRAEVALETFKIPSSRELLLDDALTMVKANSLDRKQAETQIASADAQVRQAYSTIFPTFSAGANYTVNQKEISTVFGEDLLPPGAPAPEPFVIQNKTDWRWNLSAQVGANPRAIPLLRGALLQRSIAADQIDVIDYQLEQAVIRSYYALVTMRGLMVLAAEQFESARTLLNATQKLVEAGTSNQFELTRAKIRVVQAEKDVERTRLQFLKLRESLSNLLETPADFDVVTPANPGAPEPLAALKERAVQQRQDLHVARRQIELAQQYVDEVYFRYLPALNATFTYAGARESAFAPSEPQWTLMFGASWLIWDGGFREGEIKLRKAQRLAAEIEVEKVASRIESELDNAHADYLSSVNQVESGLTQVELAEEALRQARIAYKYGAATQLDLINAEDQVKVAKISLVQDQLAVELAVRELRHLVGRRD